MTTILPLAKSLWDCHQFEDDPRLIFSIIPFSEAILKFNLILMRALKINSKT